jgi:two-component system sensor histidine kinase HydH
MENWMLWFKRKTQQWLGEGPVPDAPFNLTRWFALLASVAIGATALVVASLLAALFTDRMLARDGQLTASFIDALARVESPAALFQAPHPGGRVATLPEFFSHVAALEDALRINAYRSDGTVIWSTDEAIIGSRFTDNDELDDALKGEVVVHSGQASRHPKPEHVDLSSPGGPFVENYIPVWSADRSAVIGVIEVYRVPVQLFDAISTGRQLIWAGAVIGGGLLFLTLWWAVRRADRIMFRQREQLLEAQTLATVGELSRAVAHSVRNPLAAIRSSAELELNSPPSAAPGRDATMTDIIGLVDRIDRLLTDMLSYSAPSSGDGPAGADLGRVVKRTLDAFAQEFKRHRIEVSSALPAGLPPVSGDERLLAQALASVMSNAVEAMPDGGRIEVAGEVSGDRRAVRLSVRDSGIGMAADQVARAFDPFYTNKARGLGIGLALVKRIVELSRGHISLTSQPGRGTTVDFTFRAAGGTSA